MLQQRLTIRCSEQIIFPFWQFDFFEYTMPLYHNFCLGNWDLLDLTVLTVYLYFRLDIEAYKDFEGQVYQVNLDKGRLGIGLSIAGGKGAESDHIFVINVKPGGPADLDGRIISGDVILEVTYI